MFLSIEIPSERQTFIFASPDEARAFLDNKFLDQPFALIGYECSEDGIIYPECDAVLFDSIAWLYED